MKPWQKKMDYLYFRERYVKIQSLLLEAFRRMLEALQLL